MKSASNPPNAVLRACETCTLDDTDALAAVMNPFAFWPNQGGTTELGLAIVPRPGKPTLLVTYNLNGKVENIREWSKREEVNAIAMFRQNHLERLGIARITAQMLESEEVKVSFKGSDGFLSGLSSEALGDFDTSKFSTESVTSAIESYLNMAARLNAALKLIASAPAAAPEEAASGAASGSGGAGGSVSSVPGPLAPPSVSPPPPLPPPPCAALSVSAASAPAGAPEAAASGAASGRGCVSAASAPAGAPKAGSGAASVCWTHALSVLAPPSAAATGGGVGAVLSTAATGAGVSCSSSAHLQRLEEFDIGRRS